MCIFGLTYVTILRVRLSYIGAFFNHNFGKTSIKSVGVVIWRRINTKKVTREITFFLAEAELQFLNMTLPLINIYVQVKFQKARIRSVGVIIRTRINKTKVTKGNNSFYSASRVNVFCA